MTYRKLLIHPTMAVLLLLVGCSDDGTGPSEEPAALLEVSPEGGAPGVDPEGPVRVRFSHSMMGGMERYALLHRGDATGPVVEGNWDFAEDRTVLVFSPDRPLLRDTRYTVHLGGGMRDADGHTVDFHSHGDRMGGGWATSGIMGGGMHGDGHHAGDGWRHANGSHGMVFPFTTAP